ncbi:MAG: sugar phosphate nucleotidyltransferase [Nocardioides sp.]
MTLREQSSEHRYVVIVAGGAGTRLWPLSTSKLPKQMQALMSERSLIAETVGRLDGLIPIEHVFVSTTENFREQIAAQLPTLPPENLIVEPEARGTPAAFALFTSYILGIDPDAVIFSLASDHAITEIDKFQQTLDHTFDYIEAHPGELALVGIAPSRPDTGLGYVKARDVISEEPLVYSVDKYVEKPSYDVAMTYLNDGGYFWNSAYYCFHARTLIAAYNDEDTRLVAQTAEYLKTGDPEAYLAAPVKAHEIDIIDTRKYPLALVPAEFRWSDIGNWAALHRSLAELMGTDVVSRNAANHIDVDSRDCLVLNTDQRVVVTAGLDNVAVITTDEAVFVVDMRQLEAMPSTMQELFKRLQFEGKGELL